MDEVVRRPRAAMHGTCHRPGRGRERLRMRLRLSLILRGQCGMTSQPPRHFWRFEMTRHVSRRKFMSLLGAGAAAATVPAVWIRAGDTAAIDKDRVSFFFVSDTHYPPAWVFH